jgi:hypothetical protein
VARIRSKRLIKATNFPNFLDCFRSVYWAAMSKIAKRHSAANTAGTRSRPGPNHTAAERLALKVEEECKSAEVEAKRVQDRAAKRAEAAIQREKNKVDEVAEQARKKQEKEAKERARAAKR